MLPPGQQPAFSTAVQLERSQVGLCPRWEQQLSTTYDQSLQGWFCPESHMLLTVPDCARGERGLLRNELSRGVNNEGNDLRVLCADMYNLPRALNMYLCN